MKGKVFRSTGSWYDVQLDDGRHVEARLRGKMRITSGKSTNPIAVGDDVEIAFEDGDAGNAVISDVIDRKNYISRESPRHQYSRHIIAANIDMAFVIATINQPRTSTGFIDRFLVTAEAFHIPAQIIFNKQDVYKAKDLQKQDEYVAIYEEVGYTVHKVSALDPTSVKHLRQIMDGKTSLFAGHSGVGKSTLLNAIQPGLQLRTAEISEKHNKGKHTTTYAEIFQLDPLPGSANERTYIIDTPGIKEFGILDMEPNEVGHYFPEMEAILHDCRFSNCLHLEEPGCAIRTAVEQGDIPYERYKNYVGIVMNAQERPRY